ncbi:MAG: type polyketide synthase [Peptococcaceae bacterium]|nr:type polyketide synthase [Peptococcaceae bacterium]
MGLSASAIDSCLEQAGLVPSEIDALIFVSSMGIATPAIDAHLFNVMGLRPDIKRLPLWGLGCAGGAAGLARAFDLARTGLTLIITQTFDFQLFK